MRFALVLLLFGVQAFAADPFEWETRKVEVAGDPAFKSLEVRQRLFRVIVEGEEHFGFSATAAFETRAIEQLGSFGLVQLVRGCKIDSCRKADGSIERRVSTVAPSFGDLVPWDFPDWIVDSIDSDPVYNSFDDRPELHRIAAYRWNSVPGSFDRRTERFFGNATPAEPRLYVTDTVGVSYYQPELGCSHDVSLQFRICAYRLADLPVRSTRERVDFAVPPLGCLDWGGSHVYDHAQGKFVSVKGGPIDAVCPAGRL